MGRVQRRRRRLPASANAEPVTAEPFTAARVTAEPVTAARVTAEPVTAARVTAEPVTRQRPSPQDLAELAAAFAQTASVHDPAAPQPGPPKHAPPVRPDHDTHHDAHHDHDEVVVERSLRGLVGSGATQVSVTAAMRTRDAARPSEQDLATAEGELVIVRRHWVARDDLPRPGRSH